MLVTFSYESPAVQMEPVVFDAFLAQGGILWRGFSEGRAPNNVLDAGKCPQGKAPLNSHQISLEGIAVPGCGAGLQGQSFQLVRPLTMGVNV